MKKIEQISRKFFHSIHLKHLEDTKSALRLRNLIEEENLGLKKGYFNNKICLDAGCGTSFHGSINLINCGAKKVIGVDLDKTILKKLNVIKKKVLKKNEYKLVAKIGSVLDLPFKREEFDFVLCQGVLHHTVKPLKGFKECYRVLKKGGRAYFQVAGKGGLVNEFVMSYLREMYKKNYKFKKFINSSKKNSIDKFLNQLIRNVKTGKKKYNIKSKQLLIGLKNLIDEDFILSLKDRVVSPIYNEYDYRELNLLLKNVGFKKIKRVYTKVQYSNLRNVFAFYYQNPNLDISKFLYGSGSLNVIVSK